MVETVPVASTQIRHVKNAEQTSPLNTRQPLNYSTNSQFSEGPKCSKRCLKLSTIGTPPKPHETSSHTTVYDNTFNIIGTSTSISCSKPPYTIILILGTAKIWRACRKWQGERFPWHAAFTAQFFYLFCPTSFPIL